MFIHMRHHIPNPELKTNQAAFRSVVAISFLAPGLSAKQTLVSDGDQSLN